MRILIRCGAVLALLFVSVHVHAAEGDEDDALLKQEAAQVRSCVKTAIQEAAHSGVTDRGNVTTFVLTRCSGIEQDSISRHLQIPRAAAKELADAMTSLMFVQEAYPDEYQDAIQKLKALK